MAIPLEATSLEASSCSHGISIHRFHGSFNSLLPWKLVGASIEKMEAFMEVVETSLELLEASVVVKVSRFSWKLVGACVSFHGRGSLCKLPANHSSACVRFRRSTGLYSHHQQGKRPACWRLTSLTAGAVLCRFVQTRRLQNRPNLG